MKSGDLKSYKNKLIELIEEFRNEGSRKRHNGEENDVQRKKYKYSNEESEIIMKAVREYMEVHNVTAQDLCPALRGSNEDNLEMRVKRKPCELWNQLHQVLPNRTTQSLYEFAQTKLYREHNNVPWEQEDIDRVLSLAQSHGTQWSYIGRLIGKFPGIVYTCTFRSICIYISVLIV